MNAKITWAMRCAMIFLLLAIIIPVVAAINVHSTDTANATLIADFSAVPCTGEAPLTVAFNDQSAGTPDRWEWDFGDGSSSTDQSPDHQYKTAGTYSVTLTIWNGNDRAEFTKNDLITVNNVPLVAVFDASPYSGDLPLQVTFTDRSTGSPDSWQWDFGDGGTSSERNPSHTYISPGTFNVTLNVGRGTETNVSRPRSVKVNEEALKAAFTADPQSGTKPLTVSFKDRSTGKPTWWIWDYGDGENYKTVDPARSSPTHQYSGSGCFTVSLTIGRDEEINTEKKAGYIKVGSDAAFTATPVTGNAPLSVRFSDTTPGTVLKRCWSFGDGTWFNSTDDAGREPTHIYQDAGNFTVILHVTRNSGTETVTRSNLIAVPMQAQFSATPTSGKIPLKVSFTDSSRGRPVSWCWSFGDGNWFNTTQQSKANATHTYTKSGTYSVTLIVRSSFGSKDTEVKNKYITVSATSVSATATTKQTSAVPASRPATRVTTVALSTPHIQSSSSTGNQEAAVNSQSHEGGGHFITDLLMGGLIAGCLIGGYIVLDRRK